VSDTLIAVQVLVAEGKVRISEHGYDELTDEVYSPSMSLAVSMPPLRSRTIRSLRKDRVFWSCKGIPLAGPYTCYGEFQVAARSRPSW
jgi:hypothetical protein